MSGVAAAKSRADVKQTAQTLGARKTFFRKCLAHRSTLGSRANASHLDVHLLQKSRSLLHPHSRHIRKRQSWPPHSTRSRATAHLARTHLRSRPASPMLSTSSRPTSPTCAPRFVLCNSSRPARYERYLLYIRIRIPSLEKDKKERLVLHTHIHICF